MKSFNPKYLLLASAILTMFLSHLSAQAQPAGARGENFIYIMQAGDTISSVAERFTNKPSNWRRIKIFNKITRDNNIPVGKEILVPFTLIDTSPDQAVIMNIVGDVTINDQPIDKNTLITEDSRIKTGKKSSMTFKLSNDNIISVAPDSIIYIQRLQKFSGTGLIDVIFKTEKGEFSAKVESNNGGVGRFEIRTPVSITGVRGTSLRSRVSSQGDSMVELLSGRATVSENDASANTQEQNIPEQQGAIISHERKLTLSPLPEAPQYTATLEDYTDFKLTIKHQKDARSYLIRYTKDERGLLEITRYHTTQPNTTLPLPKQSRFYLQVRAINHQGLAGDDFTKSIVIPRKPSESDSRAGGSQLFASPERTIVF